MSPRFDIPGDPGSIRTHAADLRSRGTGFVSVADGLESISTSGWESLSATMFREQFSVEPGRWRDAGQGFVTAATALEAYAGQLETAQATAAWATTEYARGDDATTQAKAACDADVARGQREKAAYEAQGGTYTLTILPFVDPGQAIRDNATSTFETAKSTLDGQAHTCADGVRAGCAGAPAKRNWLESGLAFVGDVFVGIWEGVEGLAELAMMPFTMISDMLTDLTKLATGELTPEELAMKYQLKVEDAQAVLQAFLDDPVGFAKEIGKAILDWDTWSDNPAKAIGHLVPDIILAVATLGAGTAASATERGVTGVARGAEAVEEVATVATKLDEVADVTKVFRVEGPGNARLEIGADGSVAIKGDQALFLNFGDEARAVEFLQKRLGQGFDDSVIKSFGVPSSYADDIAARAVPERYAKQTGASVFQVDTARTASSYGLRASEFERLLESIIPGSGR